MPRSANGTYTLPIAAFVPGGLIKSSDHNSNYGDIATALTQSLATTGVSTMTGPLLGASGLVTAPGYAFSSGAKTGFFLAGSNQIGWAANGVQGATLNADLSTTWAGSATFTGTISATKGTIPIGAVVDFAGATAPSGWLLCFGQLVSTTTYASLFAQLSTTYGSGAGTFGIPDYRGRTGHGQDNMGGSAANRITVAGGNFDGTVLGNSGGLQNHSLLLGELPTGIVGNNSNSPVFTATQIGGFSPVSTNSSNFTAPSGANVLGTDPATGNVQHVQTQFTLGSGSLAIQVTNASGQPHTVLNPAIITNKIIYAGV